MKNSININNSRTKQAEYNSILPRAVGIPLGRGSASPAQSGFLSAEILPAPRSQDSSRQRFCQPRAVGIPLGRGSASSAQSGFLSAEVLPAPRSRDSSRQRFCQLRAVGIPLGRDSASSAQSGILPGRDSASQYNVLSPFEIKSFLFRPIVLILKFYPHD
ncbi:hypothetical protein HMPREF9140_00797 [Prevotella micans F0438]|uniref:Uncharacterized protein n=1 Tax=Prevotella micans F0438 TaxID=883158 RepID=H1Q1K9_9BACT|nr:hypothetical protein HMPREF9140_00797 [Prevotella micans F0438]